MGKFRQMSTELLPLIYVENWFPCPILSIIWSIFFNFCTKVYISKEYYGIAECLILANNNKVKTLALNFEQ